jgi:adenylate cyclase
MESLLKAFNDGLAAYKNKQWDDAIALFQEVLRIHIHSNDGPANLYIQRCQKYKQTSPPDDWDGVFVMKTK